MQKKFLVIAVILSASLFQSFSSEKTYTLKVKVYDLQNSKGNVVVMIYNKDGSIPDKTFTHYYKKKVVKINHKEAYVEFKNLLIGQYAINMFHDENKNGKLDKGWAKPKEGFGLSNFKKVSIFNRPNFKKASFVFDKDTLVQIKTIYM